ncbi:hypothetical protein CDCA_CDCA02G0627 [Cyanidium caldarium]|uniref:Methionine aminopeptidase n=1 Tax=Cyanidium caldarium TaxID=2771 RepID=A0AAV9IQN3_CYACA|nr:hypothetical protein CDCA_CDCA02G0627 [Cyanidium caldarium]|eukprot:ctg_477.g146
MAFVETLSSTVAAATSRPRRVPRRGSLALWLSTRGRGFGKPAAGQKGREAARARPRLEPVRPGTVSATRAVPEHILRPDYAGGPKQKWASRLLSRFPWDIEVKTPEEMDGMRRAGKVAREVLDAACKAVRVGTTTEEIDAIVHEETLKRGAYPSPLLYQGFPKSCCTSINEVVCHGIPDSRQLRDGDMMNIDVTCYVDGFHGDCSEMVLVGEVDDAGKQLVRVTYECLMRAISVCRPDAEYSDIGCAIEEHAKPYGYGVIRDFCGHGIGRVFHTVPNVLHYRNREPLGRMRVGHTFTIEPMINESAEVRTRTWPDGWTTVTVDGARSAQYEHTLLIVEGGVEILTRKNGDSFPLFWETEEA